MIFFTFLKNYVCAKYTKPPYLHKQGGSCLIIFLKILNLFHNLAEYLRAVLREITVFDQTYFDVKLELIADDLIIKPIRKGRFGIDDLLDLVGKRLALIINNDAVHLFVCTILPKNSCKKDSSAFLSLSLVFLRRGT